MVDLSALSVPGGEHLEVKQLLWVLEDGFGILVEEAAHVTVLPGQQAFQEANVATPSCDKQCNMGGVLGRL